jgi:hypothetical protein
MWVGADDSWKKTPIQVLQIMPFRIRTGRYCAPFTKGIIDKAVSSNKNTVLQE